MSAKVDAHIHQAADGTWEADVRGLAGRLVLHVTDGRSAEDLVDLIGQLADPIEWHIEPASEPIA
jgi:hypothetical protein